MTMDDNQGYNNIEDPGSPYYINPYLVSLFYLKN